MIALRLSLLRVLQFEVDDEMGGTVGGNGIQNSGCNIPLAANLI